MASWQSVQARQSCHVQGTYEGILASCEYCPADSVESLSNTVQDFDIAGVWDPMVPDAEVIGVLCTILTRLEVGEFTVKVLHPLSYTFPVPSQSFYIAESPQNP